MPTLTPEQYLAIERSADIKSEYYEGQMFAMSGGSLPHSLIPAQLTAALVYALRGRGCRVVTSDLKVRVSAQGPYFYPDLTVYCGEPQLADDHKDILLNPRVLFEVLSPSSEAFDRGLKFEAYSGIESLQEYVPVSQSRPRMEVYTRQPEGKWLLSAYTGLEAECRFSSLDCSVRLAEIYDGIVFDD